jgi:hypothetical protein
MAEVSRIPAPHCSLVNMIVAALRQRAASRGIARETYAGKHVKAAYRDFFLNPLEISSGMYSGTGI